jgi:hypothetical protein
MFNPVDLPTLRNHDRNFGFRMWRCREGKVTKAIRCGASAIGCIFALAGSIAGCAGALDPGATLSRYGMVGTFSDDCSRPIADGGAIAIYDVRPGVAPTVTAINRAGTFQSKIVRADPISPTDLVMYINQPDGSLEEVEVRKEDRGFRTMRMVVHRRNEYFPAVAVNHGALAGGSDRGTMAERCIGGEAADNALP